MKLFGIFLIASGVGLILLCFVPFTGASRFYFWGKTAIFLLGIPGIVLIQWGRNCLKPDTDIENEEI